MNDQAAAPDIDNVLLQLGEFSYCMLTVVLFHCNLIFRLAYLSDKLKVTVFSVV